MDASFDLVPHLGGPCAQPPRGPCHPLVLDSEMQRIYSLIERLGPATIPILLLGETGSGKEVLADWVHRTSRLRSRPFLKINCAGLSESVVESELFGHERGAFTGAVQQHRGVFETADGGTLFLDEVAELPQRTQAKLLRVLESGEISRLGSTAVRKVAVRLVAATHRELPALVERGEFRRDLFFRLNGATIEIPPLRRRRVDILPLARLFLERAAQQLGRPGLMLDASALQALLDHEWPGNVRELRNVMDRAAALSEGAQVRVEALWLGPRRATTGEASDVLPADPSPVVQPKAALSADLRAAVLGFERSRILDALAESDGNQTEAARLLGISRRTLTNKLNLHGVARPRKPSDPPAPGLLEPKALGDRRH